LLFGSIVTGIDMYMGNNQKDLIQETISVTENINNIDIKLGIAKFEIKTGEQFEVKLNNVHKDIKVKTDNNTLQIEDKGSFEFFKGKNQEIIIYIPEGIEFENVYINSGVGKAYIESLHTEQIDLHMGVGDVRIKELNSKENTKIDGGVGRLEIQSGYIGNLNLNSGVGECIINTKLTGNSKIDNGIGKVRLDIDGNIKDYTIKTKKGIGTITINREKCIDNYSYGSGNNKIDISGGIGEVEITIY